MTIIAQCCPSRLAVFASDNKNVSAVLDHSRRGGGLSEADHVARNVVPAPVSSTVGRVGHAQIQPEVKPSELQVHSNLGTGNDSSVCDSTGQQSAIRPSSSCGHGASQSQLERLTMIENLDTPSDSSKMCRAWERWANQGGYRAESQGVAYPLVGIMEREDKQDKQDRQRSRRIGQYGKP
ncbi:hypothetical protein IAQ61_007854, partial [Plenodomus lingam]|uniref:uncharacterized protein n=1 Tax=Leptosphaeria maculans TaxID=5022 RepID=UPI003321DFAB